MRKLVFSISIGFCFTLCAQEVKMTAGFVQDSIRIGEPVDYWMTARYPAELELLLPDSNYDFSPYELLDKSYYETTLDSASAVDSVIYQLQSFEIDAVQYLQLPAIIFKANDSIRFFPARDSLFFQSLAPIVTDTTSLIANTNYQQVATQLNSRLILFVLGGILLLALLVLLIFGKRIRRYYTIKRLTKGYTHFVDQLELYIRELKKDGNPELSDKAISFWKSYLERLEKEPITKLTTKEIIKYPFANALKDPLTAIDRVVYGRIPSEKIFLEFQLLEEFVQNRFNHKLEQIRNPQK